MEGYIQGETWSVALDLDSRKRHTAAGILQFMKLEIHIRNLETTGVAQDQEISHSVATLQSMSK